MKVDPEARAEVREGMIWYDENGERGDAFVSAVERVFVRIEAKPLSFPVLREDDRIHRAVVRRFPYVVYFVMLPSGEPRVIAVSHGKREHMYWAERL